PRGPGAGLRPAHGHQPADGTARGTGRPGRGAGRGAPGRVQHGAGDSTAASADGDEFPTETAGPYPGDGSNGPHLLEAAGIERSDLTTSIDGGDAADRKSTRLNSSHVKISYA